MEYKDRTYRDYFAQERWKQFVVCYKETDIWVGIDKASYQEEMPDFCKKIITELRDEMDKYILSDLEYASALISYDAKENAPEILRKMSEISHITGIGPMSAVAGAVAEYTAKKLKEKYPIKEVVIENGGDIYTDIQEDLDIAVFAGESPLSEKVGLHIEADFSPLGICTSSGTVGPSLSFGKADAVMIVCRDVLLTDSYATYFANLIKKEKDIENVLEKINDIEDILSALIIKNDKMGVIGQMELKLFERK